MLVPNKSALSDKADRLLRECFDLRPSIYAFLPRLLLPSSVPKISFYGWRDKLAVSPKMSLFVLGSLTVAGAFYTSDSSA